MNGDVYYREDDGSLSWFDWCDYERFMSHWVGQFGNQFLWVCSAK